MKNENVYQARKRQKAERQPAFKKALAALKLSRQSQAMRILNSDAPVVKFSDGQSYKGKPPQYRNINGVGMVPPYVKVVAGVPFIKAA